MRGGSRGRRCRRWCAIGVLALMGGFGERAPAAAQSSTSTLVGTVVDATGAALPGAVLTLANVATSTQRQSVSGSNGAFTLSALPPGRYTLRAKLSGFAPLEIPDIVLNVNDRIEVRVELALPNRGEEVMVRAEASRISSSPAVSTVIDREFVENLPLNGRSLHALLELTPGVVLTRAGGSSQGGQFSVNGQRTNANYFLVDGVSANAGIVAGNGVLPGQSGSGSLPAMTALGGTNGLVPVDALQEFRIQTSTYAPEFGRMPGGQVSLVTRSGTNRFQGSLFEYFRDEALDANDWFQNRAGLPKPELRQHDFGGVLGGPIVRNRMFVFGSYEGLRLLQPQVKDSSVPSLELRRSTQAVLQPYVNAFPLPNGPDVGGGFAQFVTAYSDPSRIDSTSLRIDHTSGGPLTIFGRVSHAPSFTRARGSQSPAYSDARNQDSTSVTLGATWVLSKRLVHDVRANYTRSYAPVVFQPDDFGGAVPPSVSLFAPGLNPDNSLMIFSTTGSRSWSWGVAGAYLQRQINIVDSLTFSGASHEWKMGLDYRRINPQLGGREVGYEFLSVSAANLAAGPATYIRYFNDPAQHSVAFDNLSLYVQDSWRATSRLTLSYGLRWELVPPPHTTDGDDAVTLENLDDPYGGRMHLAPRNTPLWRTRYDHLAPRVGASYVVSERDNAQLIVRGGTGLFYDLGFGQVSSAFRSYPFVTSKTLTGVSLPLSPAVREPVPLGSSAPEELWVMDRNLELPVTYQWNVAAEQGLGLRQSVTVSYVGSAGRDLLKLDRYTVNNLLDWPGSRVNVYVNRNRGYSQYHALQLQFSRRLQAGLQSVVSYTLGHAKDTSSSDAISEIPAELVPVAGEYGDSDFDVRHLFSAALTYQSAGFGGSPVLRNVTRDWGVDLMLRARSGFPLNITANTPFPPATHGARPNVVPGEPFWLDDPAAPGGRRLNRRAFLAPAAGTQGDLRRGDVRGFGVSQVDLAFRRDLRLQSRLRVQLRFELFNLLNVPNFADVQGLLTNSTFGLSNQMLNRGLGGLNALYQIGGPRSSQISVKLLF